MQQEAPNAVRDRESLRATGTATRSPIKSQSSCKSRFLRLVLGCWWVNLGMLTGSSVSTLFCRVHVHCLMIVVFATNFYKMRCLTLINRTRMNAPDLSRNYTFYCCPQGQSRSSKRRAVQSDIKIILSEYRIQTKDIKRHLFYASKLFSLLGVLINIMETLRGSTAFCKVSPYFQSTVTLAIEYPTKCDVLNSKTLACLISRRYIFYGSPEGQSRSSRRRLMQSGTENLLRIQEVTWSKPKPLRPIQKQGSCHCLWSIVKCLWIWKRSGDLRGSSLSTAFCRLLYWIFGVVSCASVSSTKCKTIHTSSPGATPSTDAVAHQAKAEPAGGAHGKHAGTEGNLFWGPETTTKHNQTQQTTNNNYQVWSLLVFSSLCLCSWSIDEFWNAHRIHCIL